MHYLCASNRHVCPKIKKKTANGQNDIIHADTVTEYTGILLFMFSMHRDSVDNTVEENSSVFSSSP